MDKIFKHVVPMQGQIRARIRLPGSKSVTHRALLMAALGPEKTEIVNPLESEDILLTAGALKQLGVQLHWGKDRIEVQPPMKRWLEPTEPVFLGNSGTSMRLLPAVAATGMSRAVFDGTDRLRERPVGPVADALRQLGVDCRFLRGEGYPPLEIVSRGLRGGNVQVDASQSSQFLSALLIAAPCAAREVHIRWTEPVASFPYVELTLKMMSEAGIRTEWLSRTEVAVPAPQEYAVDRYLVEGDCSSASYFWAAAAMLGGEVFTWPITPGTSQGDCRLLGVLEEMGCRVIWEEEGVTVQGSGSLKPLDLDMNRMPDVVPTLAVLAACAQGRTWIRNVAHLRVKESDRLQAVARELSKFDVPVQELPDGLIIDGGTVRPPAEGIHVYNDHRIAMAFALLGLKTEGVVIHGAEAVGKSFPNFWEVFDELNRG